MPGHARRGQSGRPETRGGGDRPGRSEKRCRCLSQVARSAEAGVRVLLNRVVNESRGSSQCPPSLGRRDWGGSARRGSPIVSVVTRCYRHRRCSQGGDVGCCGQRLPGGGDGGRSRTSRSPLPAASRLRGGEPCPPPAPPRPRRRGRPEPLLSLRSFLCWHTSALLLCPFFSWGFGVFVLILGVFAC